MHTSNAISVSTGGKPGYTLIKDNFSWGLLLGVLVQRAIPGGRSCKVLFLMVGATRALPKSSVKQTTVFQEVLCSFLLQTECPLASSTCCFRLLVSNFEGY